ncbi:MAG: O-antigen ligase family protein [Notoacmeibacter sp.]|nr:O-antigen ligase family protein [Notoacmeibacter sp.]MCC0031892.1 O-antigen ligase family protein [Brucellaceae bacterium]
MSAITHYGAALPRAAVNAKLVAIVSSFAAALAVFLAGFVIREPAPYELYMAALLPVWGLMGLRLSRGIMPLTVLIVTFNIGGFLSMLTMAEIRDTPLYLAVSLFLGFTAIFFAAVIEARPALFRPMFHAWVIGATGTSILGILGYFHAFPGAEAFTLYNRAAGAFQDPNVFGPYLVAPAFYLIHRLVTGPVSRMPLIAVPLLIISLGIFLSFSRGAWGLFGIGTIVLVGMLFLQDPSPKFRLRVLVMSGIAVVLLVVAVLIALQIPSVADLFQTRAKIVQDYDGARLGRFARHAIGFMMAMEKPLGIGPLNFGLMFGEDTHNIWLKALMDYGWLGFFSYFLLIMWTLAAGFRILFRQRPWQPFFMCAYSALLGHVLLGTVIDTDHWRHFYILLGMVWGVIALEMRVQGARARGREHPALLPA